MGVFTRCLIWHFRCLYDDVNPIWTLETLSHPQIRHTVARRNRKMVTLKLDIVANGDMQCCGSGQKWDIEESEMGAGSGLWQKAGCYRRSDMEERNWNGGRKWIKTRFSLYSTLAGEGELSPYQVPDLLNSQYYYSVRQDTDWTTLWVGRLHSLSPLLAQNWGDL